MASDIRVKIFADATEFSRGLREAETRSESFGSKLGGLAKTATLVGGAALAGGLVVGLDKSIEAAMNAQVATARLDAAFKTAGLSAVNYQAGIDQAESSGRKLGFTNEQTQTSLGSLIVATHDAGKAFADVAVAADVARFKHTDLESATKLLTTAMAGSQRSLKALGLSIAPVTENYDALKEKYKELGQAIPPAEAAQAKFLDKQATAQQVIELVSEKLKGQSKAYADTAAGGMAQFHAQLGNLEEKIGTGLLPAFTKMIEGANKAIDFMTKNWPDIKEAVQKAWNAIEPDLNAARDLFLAVAKVVEDHWPTISKIATDVGHVIEAEMKAIGDAIRIVTDILHGDWAKAWNDAKSLVADILHSMEGIVKTALDAIVAVAGGLGNALVGAIEGPVNAFIDRWNSLGFDLPSISILGHKIGGEHIGVPQVPHLATGGIVTQPTLALIGEAGPEAVVPLSRGGGMGNTYVFNFPNYVGSKDELIATVRKGLTQEKRRGTVLGFT